MVACICHSPLHHQKPDFEGQSVIKTSSYLLPFVLEAHRESLPRSCETSARRLSAESAEVYSTADLPASAAHTFPSHIAEIRDGTMKEVLEKLRRLSYDIEEINKRFDTLDRTAVTLEDYYENEMVNLRKQVERGSAPLPPQSQQVGTVRFPIPTYSGKRSTPYRFLKHFYTWALSSQSEDALKHSRPIIMTGDSSRREMEREYGRHIVEQSLVV